MKTYFRKIRKLLALLLTLVLLLSAAPVAIAESFSAFVKSSSMPVYSDAALTNAVGRLGQYTVVTVLEYSGQVARIQSDGYTGYARVSDMDAVEAVAVKGVVNAATRAYRTPSTASQSVALAAGTRVNVIKIVNGWALIEKDGVGAFTNAACLSPVTETVTPAPTSEVIPATVTGPAAHVYGSNGKYLGTMAVGTQVNVIETQNSWAHIEMSGHYGFCQLSQLTANAYLSTATPAPTATPTPTAPANSIPGRVTASSLTVYQQPGTSASVVATLQMNDLVNVIAIQKGWAYIEFSGTYGFCLVSGLTPAENTTAAPTGAPSDYIRETFSATVVVTGGKLYAEASTGAQSQSLSMGTNVTVGAYNNQWAYVDCNGVKGFVLISDLSRNAYTALSKGSSGSDVNALEKALLTLGYFDAQPGSSYSSYTENAVKLFQTACGLSVTGVADVATQRVLYAGNAPACSLLSGSYAKGSKGDSVLRIQTRLLALGYLSKTSSVDGDFGSNTLNAVKLFQSCNGLSTSDTADSTTLRKLYSTSASSLPSDKNPADVSTVVQPSAGDQTNNSTTISSTLASKTSSYSSSMNAAEKLEYAIYVGQNQLGKPYVYGANGTSSFDCTGFTCYCFKQIGITLPRTAVNQGYSNTYTKIGSVSELRRGDLVYFNTISDSDLSDHAGIYLGAGYFIHASSGQGKVVVSTLASGYYNQVFSWGRRVFD